MYFDVLKEIVSKNFFKHFSKFKPWNSNLGVQNTFDLYFLKSIKDLLENFFGIYFTDFVFKCIKMY